MLYSICLPIINQSTIILNTIENAIRTNKNAIEIIVPDFLFTDHVRDIQKTYHNICFKIIDQCGLSTPDYWNRFIDESDGEYILWLVEGCSFTPGLIDKYHSILQCDPSIDIIYGNINICDQNYYPTDSSLTYENFGISPELFVSKAFHGSPIPNMGTLVRKMVYLRNGGFNTDFHRAHDYEFWTRAWKGSRFYYLNETVGYWRWHDSKMSSGSVKIDYTYDARIIASLLENYSLQELFPELEWDSEQPVIAYANAYFQIGKRYLGIQYFHDALKYLSMAYQITHSPDLKNLILQILQHDSDTSKPILSAGLNILFIVHNFPPFSNAGTENYTSNLAQNLAELGNNVTVLYKDFTLEEQKTTIHTYLNEKIIVSRLVFNPNKNTEDEIVSVYQEFLNDNLFDVIHIQHLTGFPFKILKATLDSGAKTVLTLHDYWILCRRLHLFLPESRSLCNGPESSLKCARCIFPEQTEQYIHIAENYFENENTFLKKQFERIHLVTSPSHYLKNFHENFSLVNKNFIVANLGIPTSDSLTSLHRDKLRVGYIGSVHPLKNLKALFEALPLVHNDFDLVIYGNGATNDLSEMIQKIKQHKNVVYQGPYSPDKLPSILSGLDCIVIPSLLENSPITIREAFLYKTPVIASNRGGIPELIEDGVNGILFDPNHPEQLAEIITRLIVKPDILQTLKAAIPEVLSIANDAILWQNRYQELLQDSSSSEVENSIVVSIIIPVFNKIELTNRCIESIYTLTPKCNYEVIVVNNNSTDGTELQLVEFSKKYANLHVIHNPVNQGFAKANNQGFEVSKGKYIVLLNNDTEVTEDWLDPLIEILESDPEVGAVGAKLLYPDGTIQHAGVVLVDNRKIGDPLRGEHIYSKEQSDYSEANEPRYYQALTAACLMMRRELFSKLGGLDEDFWNGYEDIDLCFRIQEKGFKLVYTNKSTVIHYESQSGEERFRKAGENIQRLHHKWLGRIKSDFILEANGTVKKGPAEVIMNYPKTHPLVSIIIISYNNTEYLQYTIDSVIQRTHGIQYEIIIVDNNSAPETVEYLNSVSADLRFTVIFNKQNVGFPGANNQGIAVAKGKYLVLLNNDVIVTERWLERLITVAESSDDIGIVGPISNNISGVQLDQNAKYQSLEELSDYVNHIATGNKNVFQQFPRVAFFCVLIKRKVIDAIGGLDEVFAPGNFEDDDFCLRAQLEGFKTVIAKNVFIHHFGSKSFQSDGQKKYLKLLETNRQKFITKWGGDPDDIWLRGVTPKSHQTYYSITRYQTVGAPENQDHEQSIREIEMLIEAGELTRALEKIETLIKKDDTDCYAFINLGVVQYLSGNLTESESAFEKALLLDPSNAVARENLDLLRNKR